MSLESRTAEPASGAGGMVCFGLNLRARPLPIPERTLNARSAQRILPALVVAAILAATGGLRADRTSQAPAAFGSQTPVSMLGSRRSAAAANTSRASHFDCRAPTASAWAPNPCAAEPHFPGHNTAAPRTFLDPRPRPPSDRAVPIRRARPSAAADRRSDRRTHASQAPLQAGWNGLERSPTDIVWRPESTTFCSPGSTSQATAPTANRHRCCAAFAERRHDHEGVLRPRTTPSLNEPITEAVVRMA